MSNSTPSAATNARVRAGNWAKTTAEAIRRRGDRGQGAVEYVGVIVLVALIIAALVGSGVAETIANGLTTQVGNILGG
ncbi:hypothetical protein DDQ41_22180 [Streptomyces spongiicola]|uniref:Flp family type IVb pilin n=1 Tax=Streptomyces spongiicola TaxID=1690221 RepID=A0ABM6VB54_9ACTN|nr:hypothetical protein [Streptomyces spongiicola]AWK11175.1 hypothetical protein DDQ41_22180 [Streptomyces spongiicola]